MSFRVYIFTYAFVLPGSEVDGHTIEVTATKESEALVLARAKADIVTRRVGLRLVETVETKMRRSA